MANWEYTIQDTKTVVFNTAGKFVDRNINVVVPAIEEEISGTVNDDKSSISAEISSITVGEKNGNVYSVTGSGEATATIVENIVHNVTKAGWHNKQEDAAVEISGTKTGTASLTNATIAAGELNVEASASASISSVNIGEYDAENNRYKLSGSGTISGTATAGVKTAGYMKDETSTTNLEGAASLDSSIQASSLSVAAKTGVDYLENETIIIPSEGALYIEAGYIPATMITLDQMLGGKVDPEGEKFAAPDLKEGAVAYDGDGKKIVGTMTASQITGEDEEGIIDASASVTPNLVSGTYNTTGGTGYTYSIVAEASAEVEDIEASKTITAGYIDTDKTVKASITGDAKEVSSTLYLKDGNIVLSAAGGVPEGTIVSGTLIKIEKGYYDQDHYYKAQDSAETESISNELSATIDGDYILKTYDAKTEGKTYINLSAIGSMTAGNIYDGVSSPDNKYIEVYTGDFTNI